MIISKIKKIILILPILVLTQCYTDPFFELTVNVVDQNLNPISNAIVKTVSDTKNDTLLDYINQSEITNGDGKAFFTFENKAFLTVIACYDNSMSGIEGDEFLCKEGQIYLEENINKNITLMLQGDCDNEYCF